MKATRIENQPEINENFIQLNLVGYRHSKVLHFSNKWVKVRMMVDMFGEEAGLYHKHVFMVGIYIWDEENEHWEYLAKFCWMKLDMLEDFEEIEKGDLLEMTLKTTWEGKDSLKISQMPQDYKTSKRF